MRSRLHAHTKVMMSTGTLQLNMLTCLKDHVVISGAIPCVNYQQYESDIRKKYPDILKT